MQRARSLVQQWDDQLQSQWGGQLRSSRWSRQGDYDLCEHYEARLPGETIGETIENGMLFEPSSDISVVCSRVRLLTLQDETPAQEKGEGRIPMSMYV